jgi:hypothetical protein
VYDQTVVKQTPAGEHGPPPIPPPFDVSVTFRTTGVSTLVSGAVAHSGDGSTLVPPQPQLASVNIKPIRTHPMRAVYYPLRVNLSAVFQTNAIKLG